MEDIFGRLYGMTAFSNIIEDPSFLVMYAIAFILLYLGIKKHYEPLLLVPIYNPKKYNRIIRHNTQPYL